MMPERNRPEVNRELLGLVGALLNDAATQEQRQRLAELLKGDPDARRAYRRHVNLHASLKLRYKAMPQHVDEGAGCRGALPLKNIEQQAKPTRFTRRMAWSAAAALAAVLLIALLLVHERFRQQPTVPGTPAVLARITHSAGAKWAEEPQSVAVGTGFGAGKLELTHGFVELTFGSDAKAILQAPVRLDLTGPRHVRLHLGQLVVRADGAKGEFVVETPKTRVTDLGTEFGVGVGPSGDTQVQVYEGKVVAEWKAAEGGASGRRQLDAGQAMRIDRRAETFEPLAFSPDRFVRTFPIIEGDTQGGPIYNRSRLDAVHIVPAMGPVTVDGSLSDWNLSRQFSSACTKPYDKAYFVQGAMMFDSQYLYIGAHVGDPAPLRNSRDMATDPEMAWQGGSVVVRLSTDPALGWPLLKEYGYVSDAPPGQTPHGSNSIVHLMMWYDAKAQQARLGLEHGLDFHGRRFDAQGWQGAFVRDADGRGYTMEYAIPWSLLNPRPGPPRGGEVTAASWIVHWSDAGGKIGRGYLVEITNPAEPRYDLMIGRTWGKAVFHAPGQ